jgi:hypothetical protein
MVYKKYIKKDGKLYGPYIYQSKRVDGKVVSEYLGVDESKINNKNKIIFLISIFLIVTFVLLYLFVFNKSFTGKVTLENTNQNIQNSYSLPLSLVLKEGELIPESSTLILESSNETKKYVLKDIIPKNFSSFGNFYLEKSNLSEEGKGFGIEGENIIYPEITFKLLIKKSLTREKTSNNKINLINETPSVNTTSLTNQNDNLPQNENINPNEDSSKNETSNSKETIDESVQIDNLQENNLINSESSADKTTLINNNIDKTENKDNINTSDETKTSVLDSIQNTISNLFLILSPTGRVTQSDSSDFYEINGKVSKDNPFSYELNPGESVELVSGSVKYNNKNLQDSILSIKQEGNFIIIQTDYSENEKGFGEGYIGKTYTIPLDIKDIPFSETILNQDKINVYIAYNNETIAFIKEINLSKTIKENQIPLNIDNGINNDSSLLNESTFILDNQTELQNHSIFNESLLLENLSENFTLSNFTIPLLSLTDNEKELFLSKFSNDSLKITKSEFFNGRYIISYQLKNYYVEYSYDINLENETLKTLIENDKIKWIKDILNKESNKEINSQPLSEDIKNLINPSVI